MYINIKLIQILSDRINYSHTTWLMYIKKNYSEKIKNFKYALILSKLIR